MEGDETHSKAAQGGSSSSDEASERYEILELLGAGGMGQVYRALDRSLDREVALKILRGDDPSLRDRALREARHQARVDHENVVRVYDAGEREGKPYVAMQLVEGQTLGEIAARLDIRGRVQLMRQVAEGVQAAHSRGLIHRDLKPGNILVERRDDSWHPWVVDFGLALDPEQPGITATGAMVGTPAFMPPEQIRGERTRLDRRADVYSLGATQFQVLTGRPPFEGNPLEVTLQALKDDPPSIRDLDPSLPKELALITAKCLEKEPERRYGSARLLAEDLDRFQRGEPVLAQPPSIGDRLRRWFGRHRAVATVTAAATFLLLVLVASNLRIRWRAQEASRWARELGRETERVSGALRLAEMGPRRDLGPFRDELRREIEALEERTLREAPRALSSAQVAMAEALLFLGDLEESRARVERAIELGAEGEDVDKVKAQVLGRLFLARRNEIRRLSPRWRARELERETAELLEPALAALARVPDRDAAGQAFAALLRGDLIVAQKHAEEAVAEDPYDVRLMLLLAEVRAERAYAAHESENQSEALEYLARAEVDLGRAGDVARSHPEVFASRCKLADLRLDVELFGSIPLDQDLQTLLRPCDLAVEANSTSPFPLGRRAGLRRRLAARSMRKGVDPMPDIDAAITDGEAALALDGSFVDALYQTGVAYSLRANHAAGKDEEIERDLERATRLLRRCVETVPAFLPCRISLGVNLLETGIHLDNVGLRGEEELRSAIEEMEGALGLAPDVAVLHNNQGYTRVYLAEVLLRDAVDPRPMLETARRSLSRARNLAPDYASAPNSLGESYRVEALFLWAQGKDPSSAVAGAREAFGEALRLDPERYYSALGLVMTEILGIRSGLELGEDVDSALDRAGEVLGRLDAIAGEEHRCERAEILLLRARSEAVGGQSIRERLVREVVPEDCPHEWIEIVLDRTRGAENDATELAAARDLAARFLAEVPRDWQVEGLAARLAEATAAELDGRDERRTALEAEAAEHRRQGLEVFGAVAPRWRTEAGRG